MFKNIVLVGAGGAVGSIFRYLIAIVLKESSAQFPWATFTVNIAGCFIIGVLFGWAEKYEWMQGSLLLFLATGFCGGFTTFSSFALENIGLFQKHLTVTAILYMMLSLFLGLLLCRSGFSLVR